MRCVRKFLSLVAVAALAVVPLVSEGCNDHSGGTPSTGQTASTPGTSATTTTTITKTKKEKKKKAATTDSGSTTGAGVNPPIK